MQAKPILTERCSGRGGKWGIFKENYDIAIKVGRFGARNLVNGNPDFIVSECRLAGTHLKQVMTISNMRAVPDRNGHPIEILAKAYGFCLDINAPLSTCYY